MKKYYIRHKSTQNIKFISEEEYESFVAEWDVNGYDEMCNIVYKDDDKWYWDSKKNTPVITILEGVEKAYKFSLRETKLKRILEWNG